MSKGNAMRHKLLEPTEEAFRDALKLVSQGLADGRLAHNYNQNRMRNLDLQRGDKRRARELVCGSAQCIAGWAVTALQFAGYDTTGVELLDIWDRGWHGAEHFNGRFGVTRSLFDAFDDAPEPTPEQAVAAIDAFLAGNYVTPWGEDEDPEFER